MKSSKQLTLVRVFDKDDKCVLTKLVEEPLQVLLGRMGLNIIVSFGDMVELISTDKEKSNG